MDLVLDDFELAHWPNFPEDLDRNLAQHGVGSVTWYRMSQLAALRDRPISGWFRQQLVKLRLPEILRQDNWFVIDSDVVLLGTPDTQHVPYCVGMPEPINLGNRHYVSHLLSIPDPWLGSSPDQYLVTSGFPFRLLSRSLLEGLAQHVELTHARPLLALHLDLIEQAQLRAWNPDSRSMVMSEFQLIETYRHRLWHQPLPLREWSATPFESGFVKDWQRDRAWFEHNQLMASDQLLRKLEHFGRMHR